MSKAVEPSINETAFSCPHCGAYTTQYWFKTFVKPISGDDPTPFIPSEADKRRFEEDTQLTTEERKDLLRWTELMLKGLVTIEENAIAEYCHNEAQNLHISQCYNCKKIAVWVHERLLSPSQKVGMAPNSDLPPEIVRDFEEAREIADISPRGAAALLRLCIQKLCTHLGEKGKNIDDDIGNLVKKGLNPLVQQSLDVVRVIGNEAVHPGVFDLKDDRKTTLLLFRLTNAIADQMISHPKSVQTIYEKLPESKRKAIEKRDSKPL